MPHNKSGAFAAFFGREACLAEPMVPLGGAALFKNGRWIYFYQQPYAPISGIFAGGQQALYHCVPGRRPPGCNDTGVDTSTAKPAGPAADPVSRVRSFPEREWTCSCTPWRRSKEENWQLTIVGSLTSDEAYSRKIFQLISTLGLTHRVGSAWSSPGRGFNQLFEAKPYSGGSFLHRRAGSGIPGRNVLRAGATGLRGRGRGRSYYFGAGGIFDSPQRRAGADGQAPGTADGYCQAVSHEPGSQGADCPASFLGANRCFYTGISADLD